ncbi:MAG: TIGR00159 family protein [Lachnospiraceae bacterium]|jgi:TIGR00159 family protein|nr:TIGR00159 family protein [Lachnospiraceae bacterium]MCI8779241.1 TIGR00159 family protein [Lachnospiraceae bacterium]
MESIIQAIQDTFYFLSLPRMTLIDLVEVIIIAFALYHIILWMRKTRAWNLLKGIVVLLLCYLIAYFLDMSTILWIFNRTLAIGITALAVVFQPELRKALEELGRKNFVASIIPFDDTKDKVERFSDRSINEIVKATVELARAKTGALITLEKDISLAEYERTGINIDSAISSQLLINIFEHNTPLHDGAVILREDRVVSATCYLPLSDNLGLSKELGTRHRAGVGISEVSDSTTVIVSEETGKISVAVRGKLLRNVDGELLKKKLGELQGKSPEKKEKKKFHIGRGMKHVKVHAHKK